jgi:transcriptional regulator with XRE-family HTH domain
VQPIEAFPPERLGQRLGTMRAQFGLTQADVAARIAVSRVAVSHFEMGLAMPSERTVLLLAGLFKVAPLDLVAGTEYPAAKRERLPDAAAMYTEVELQLALLQRDLDWLASLEDAVERQHRATALATEWSQRLHSLRVTYPSALGRSAWAEASKQLQQAVSEALTGAAGVPTSSMV